MLTEDMTRLCGEIVSLRGSRASMMANLQDGAQGRKQEVAKLCTHLHHARVATAKRSKSERVAFLNGLRRTVGAQRRELRNDLAGARRAWAGKSA